MRARTFPLSLGALLVLLVLGSAAPARAARARPFLVGADVGVAIPYSALETTFLAEVEVGYRFLLDGRLGASLTLGYTRPTSAGSVPYASDMTAAGVGATGSATYDGTLDELVLGVHVFYRFFDDRHGWTPWVAVGPGFYFLRHEVRGFEATYVEKDTAYGLVGSVGVDVLLGPGAITAVVRLPWAPVDDRTLGDSTKGLGAVVIAAGYRFLF